MIRTLMDAAPFRIDLHVHSLLSEDNRAEPEECILRAIERGLHGIAFTEHYTYGASAPLEPLIARYRERILVVRAVEFSVAEGHCLVFGADTDALCLQYAPVQELIDAVNRVGGAVVPSHPYRAGSGIGDLILTLPGLAAVEGHNGCNHRSFNQRAIEGAQRRQLPCTGGSDAHAPEEVGSCYTVFPEPVSAGNLAALIRAGRCEAIDARGSLRR
jgi:predicted metal-dependent phosphoesterase TrpH